MEIRLRAVRNEVLKENLLNGQHVSFRSSGWSLYPRVHSNDQCTYKPVTAESDVKVDNIVFCQVQPGDRFYAHNVKAIDVWPSTGRTYFTIANLKGRENGWCFIEHIYGKLIEVS